MQEHRRSDDRSRPGIDQELAERLDRLTRDDAERVLETAIRLHTQRRSSETFTAEQIRHIAHELGLDDSVVDRAIRDELSRAPEAEERSWLVTVRIRDRATVTGPAAEVHDRVMAWMRNEEGLRPIAREDEGVRWEKDSHWLTSTRLAFGSDATKALRNMSEVVHRQIALAPDEHVVEIDVDARRIGLTAWGIGGGISALGMGGGVLAAFFIPGGNDLLQFATVAVPTVTVAATSAVATARLWADSIRRGVDRALSGIAHPELHSRAARRRERRRRRAESKGRGGFQRLVDEATDAVEDFFD